MTHEDIREKFMIEYDKASSTTSYPSLTQYEINTILDRAYLALIAQKVTGNNYRRSSLEADTKSISDIQPLITTTDALQFVKDNVWLNVLAEQNKLSTDVSDFLYYIIGNLKCRDDRFNKVVGEDGGQVYNAQNGGQPATTDLTQDEKSPYEQSIFNVGLVDHNSAKQFIQTATNMPWIKNPVCFIEDNRLYVAIDPMLASGITVLNNEDPQVAEFYLTYVKKPAKFVGDTDNDNDDEEFECSDAVAEELINLAVLFALENVESQRLVTKLNTRGLEA